MSKERRKPSLYDQANFLSKLTFWWLNALFGKTPESVAEASGQYDAPSSDEADLLERQLDRWWKKEVQEYAEGGEANLKKAVFNTFVLQWLFPGFVLLLAEASRLAQPYFVSIILRHITAETRLEDADAYLYGLGLCCMVLSHAVLITVYIFFTNRVALRMKTALEALLYRKVVSLSCEAVTITPTATVIEQFGTNTDVFTGVMEHMHYLWVGPLEVAVLGYMLHEQTGTAGVLCLILMLLFSLIHAVLEVAAAKLRHKIQVLTDQRYQMTGRILSVMMQVKVCCLEMTLTPLITSLRSKEIRSLRGLAAVKGILWCILGVSGRLMLLFLVLVAMDTGDSVTVSAVFTSLALLDVLAWCLYRFPVPGVRDWLSMQKALARVQCFLLLDEEKEQIKDLRLHRSVSYRNEPYADWVVDIDHMTARWPTGDIRRFQKSRLRSSTSSTKSLLHESDVEHAFSLKYLSLQVKKGELLAIVGPQNSGKTSLLMTLIGELPYEIGQIAVNGKVSFCSQEPWLFCGTIRENILFGDVYERMRYDMAIKACSLTKLLTILPEGDGTMVGERGLQLSTSYQAKLTLARAIYHNADIYLLDDILHCVDNQTRQDLMKWCVSGSLQSKTRVMVTRSIHLMKAASRIAVFREGSLYDIGTYEELQSRGVDIRDFVASEQLLSQRRGELEVEEENFRIRLALWKSQKSDSKVDDGAKQSDLRLLFKFLSNKLFWGLLPLLLSLCLATQALSVAADWLLAVWTSSNRPSYLTTHQPEDLAVGYVTSLMTSPPSVFTLAITRSPSPSSSPPSAEGLELYVVCAVLSVVVAFLFAVTEVEVCISAAKRCHVNMLDALMKARFGYFLITSTDSVLSVFLLHLSFIDTCIPYLSYLSIETLLRLVSVMVLMCIINPWLVVVSVPVAAFMASLFFFSSRLLKGVRMLRDSAREPVKVDVLETLDGLPTIRAFKRQEHFKESFDSHLNRLNWARFLGLCVFSRVVLVCIFVLILFVAVVVFVSIALAGSINDGLLALCITYCVTLFLPLHSWLRYFIKLADNMVSVDHALKLQKEEQESDWFSDKPPPDDWPNRGSITFSGTSLLAGPEGPYLLRDINRHIKSKEKVGVVGEPGSGKYSLVGALLRLGQVQGMLFMDGYDVLKIGLYELRRNIAVIPKDPVLFPGTLRSNLDLSGQLSDDELLSVLDKVDLRDRVAGIRGGLAVDVDEDSSLFSLGQRQLLCLARAIIRKTKLVIFEEATETIEHGLNDKIQRVLRAKFRDCTVLTIAHRLSSVMDCDRIMVFHHGEVKEFDTPYNLIKQEGDTAFSRLVEQCGRRQAQQLRAMAELSQQQRASASLMLEHAVFMATEQLHASTEDLTFRPGSLAWSNMARFSKSQDSLEKTHSDWGSRGDIREEADEVTRSSSKASSHSGMAPAQRLINKRRMSPGRGRKGGGVKEEAEKEKEEEEDLPLLNYDAPPRSASARNSAEDRAAGGAERSDSNREPGERIYRPNNGARSSEGRSSPDKAYKPVASGRGSRGGGSSSTQPESSPSVEYHKSSVRPQVHLPGQRESPSSIERRIIETAIDTPPAPRRNFSPFPSDGSDANASSPARVHGRSEVPTVKPPIRARIILSKDTPSEQDSKEDPERIIFC